MRGKLLKEKIELLQGKSLCPWCLKHGQMNDVYKEKCCWQLCSLMYPTVLDMTKRDNAMQVIRCVVKMGKNRRLEKWEKCILCRKKLSSQQIVQMKITYSNCYLKAISMHSVLLRGDTNSMQHNLSAAKGRKEGCVKTGVNPQLWV